MQAGGLALWTAGVPLLAAGFVLDRTAMVAAGAAALFAAVLLGGLGDILLFRRSAHPPPHDALLPTPTAGDGSRTAD